ncbi:adhesion G protein-coupled receptor E1-like [Carcharodon carcharias]|uniref:adhesion G protein-coupled receptor E1-like n=1 Tax=Carcharodon carcharias TaxID=13397 RepID=UPI001B7E7967|nr:adhesion G protein-coupled receptor E1-like [Carcharodon carcharias]
MALPRYLLVVYLSFSCDQYVMGQTCEYGYTSNSNGTCVDEDECLTSPCGPYSTCHNRIGGFHCSCQHGFASAFNQLLNGTRVSFCRDVDECLTDPCGANASCRNSKGSFSCTCVKGFYSDSGDHSFAGRRESYCKDYNECKTTSTICGNDATCHNTEGSYYCKCHKGFARSSGETNFTAYNKGCKDVDECLKNPCGSNATCGNTVGSYTCTCNPGFISSSGGTRLNHSDICVEFDCPSDDFTMCSPITLEAGSMQETSSTPEPVHEVDTPYCSVISFFHGHNVCEKLHSEEDFDSEQYLMNLTSLTNELLRNHSLMENLGAQDRQRALEVSLQSMENSVMAVTYTLSDQEKKNMSFGNIEVQMEVLRGHNISDMETTSLSAKGNQMDIHWRAVTDEEDSGLAGVALIAFSQMDSVLNGSLDHEEENMRLNSHVLTIASTRKNRQALVEPINITFRNEKEKKPRVQVVCIALNRTGVGSHWSRQGCTVIKSNMTHTICKCSHLTSFAVLMALYETQDPWHLLNLSLISYIGIGISLGCLFISFVTFLMCRGIRSTRTTIHTHLCLCLFLAELLFLVGISQTSNKVVCAIIAGFLHYFFLTVFAWMCLEGIQLYLMVVKVFNAGCLGKRHMLPFGYGLPLLIVGISAAVDRKGYGTTKHCWLSLKNNFLWSFLGPVCVIITVNLVFYSITLIKLAKKMSSIKKDEPKLKMIRTFTVTAIAQLFLLGCTWIFGIFHFQKETIAMAYIFTIINSLQGAFIFILHCLLNKQVREEFWKQLSRICCLKPILYSEFIQTSTVPMMNLQSRNASTQQSRPSSLHSTP